MLEHRRDPPVSVSAVLARELNDPFHKPSFIVRDLRFVAVGRSRLSQHPTRPPLRNSQL
jgi:hypothetical protein